MAIRIGFLVLTTATFSLGLATVGVGQNKQLDDASALSGQNVGTGNSQVVDDKQASGPSGSPPKVKSDAKISNPFDLKGAEMMEAMQSEYMADMDGGMDMEGGMEMMGGMMGGDMGMGMEGMGGMGMGSAPSRDQIFQRGLTKAIAALRDAKSDVVRDTLKTYIRDAFQKRYDQTILERRAELAEIKKRVAKLELDLKRREAAKERVINVQMQSVQLAAEGLMELNTQ